MDKETFKEELKKFVDPYLETLGIDDVVDSIDSYILDLENEADGIYPLGKPGSVVDYSK